MFVSDLIIVKNGWTKDTVPLEYMISVAGCWHFSVLITAYKSSRKAAFYT